MSRIFDALQKSEAERAVVDLAGISSAADLLQFVDREATSRWNTADQPHSSTVAHMPVIGPTVGLQTVTHVPQPAEDEENLDLFSLFQSQQVSVSSESRLVSITDQDSAAAEAFRLLTVRLRHLQQSRSIHNLLITSTVPEEGKSMVAANLACTLAQRTEQRVLLLEGDVRRPTLSQVFGLGMHSGLCEWLQGNCGLTMSIYHLDRPSLWILPAGHVPSAPLDLVQSGKLPELMRTLSTHFDWIVIDSPPVMPMADTSIWAQLADGILLVTRQGITQKRQMQRGLDNLDSTKMIGAVLNGSTNPEHDYYYYRPSFDGDVKIPTLNQI